MAPIPTDHQPPDGGRRQFLTESIRRTIAPIVDFVESRTDKLRAKTDHEFSHWLRPPGALEEAHFAEVCKRCGSCVEVCPADAIFALGESAGLSAGTPMIDPDRIACVVCDGLQCTHVCPSGALSALVDAAQIRMGLAQVYAPVCVRSSQENCTICVDRCPIGESALFFSDDGPPTVVNTGCVGCGICQQYCPTTPKAIVVKPAAGAS